MDFSKPELLNLLFLTIVLLLVFYIYYIWQKDIVENKFNKDTFLKINPNYSSAIKIVHFILKLMALVFLILALSGPRMGIELKKVNREGVDVVFALDVSKSMLVEDIAPNRLLKSIQVLSKTIDEMVSDRVGIIVYAGQAYPLMPLSFDYSMAKLLIKTINTDLVNIQGTDLSSALMLSDSFFDNNERSKIIFLISDGEDHEGNYQQLNTVLSDKKTIVCTINIGTESGGPIPIKTQSDISYKKDKNGNVVISKANANALETVAANYNGAFIKSNQTDDMVDFIFQSINTLDKTSTQEEMFSDYEDQFQWFLGFALFFILLDLMLTHKRINFIRHVIKN